MTIASFENDIVEGSSSVEPIHQEEDRDIDSLIEESEWDRAYEIFQARPEISRQIVNPSFGWTKLHWLCSIGSTPAPLIELVASQYPEAVSLPDNRFGDTPLHILGRNSQTSAEKMKILLRYLRTYDPKCDGVLTRNRFGGTALHSAGNHNAVLEVLKVLVESREGLLKVTTHEKIHAVAALYHAYIQTIPGFMIVAQIVKCNEPASIRTLIQESPHFQRFWKKAEFLSVGYYFLSRDATPRRRPDEVSNIDDDNFDNDAKYTLHGLLQCNVDINFMKVALKQKNALAMTNAADVNGNLPLHRVLQDRPYRLKEKEAIQALLTANPAATSHANNDRQLPIHIAIHNKIPWHNGVDDLVNTNATTLHQRDPTTGLYPFQLAACVGGKVSLVTAYHLLLMQPDLLRKHP